MQFEGRVNKGSRNWSIMTAANLESLKSLRGKIIKVTVEEVKPETQANEK